MGDRLDNRDLEEERFVKMCPVCDVCGEHITDEFYYTIGALKFHLDCCERHSVEGYVERQKYGY